MHCHALCLETNGLYIMHGAVNDGIHLCVRAPIIVLGLLIPGAQGHMQSAVTANIETCLCIGQAVTVRDQLPQVQCVQHDAPRRAA